MIEQFHFLRPAWLLALPMLAFILWWLRQRGFDSGSWRAVIDPQLLPHVVSGHSAQRAQPLFWMLAIVAAIAIVALAGPTWEKRQQSVYRQPASLVIALDLSRSMDAVDIRPSRLTRARHKIADILRARKEGQSALVVYAADAFAVTPLTTDIDTILALLADLETALMPAQGTRADRAMERALELFANSGVRQGDVLLVSDGISDAEFTRLQNLLQKKPGHRISVLAIGTAEGGPIPQANGGFLKSRNGDIVVTKTDTNNMLEIASRAGGAFSPISIDDIDVNTLTYIFESGLDSQQATLSDTTAELWREFGPTLLLCLLPFAALAFRRGLIWCLPLICVVLPPDAQAVDWQALWKNSDQRAMQHFEAGDPGSAAEMFSQPGWRGTAQYRSGDYTAAADTWDALDSDAARYNHATALASAGQYREALAAYDRLLRRSPDHVDARFNRDAIEDWLQQQQSEQQSDEQSSARQNESGQSRQQQSQQGDQQSDSDNAGQSAEPGQNTESQRNEAAADSDQPQESAASRSELSEQEQRAEADDQGIPTEAMANDLNEQMSEQAAQQWLRKIPDDPGGLLRRKFVYQYRNRGGVAIEEENW